MADPSTHLEQVQRAGPDRTRRVFLAAGGLLVAGAAGGGVALGLSGGSSAQAPLQPDVRAALVRAALAEVDLIAAAARAMRTASGPDRATLRLVHRNHVAHLAAVRAAIADAAYPAHPPRIRKHARHVPGELAAAEARAARAGARRALELTGAPSALLASIAACEAGHAELLR
jgi:hypothetical protein